MSNISATALPSNARLLKATGIALLAAGVLLVTTVLPAEYGIDPTGIGRRLGLHALAHTEATSAPASQPDTGLDAGAQLRNAAEAAKAVQAFGSNSKQSFAAEAWTPSDGQPKHDSLTVTLAPGKGAEAKTLLKAGQGFVFRWIADGDVAVDMHGERTGVKGPWTSYAVESAQREAGGTFTAPFDGSHGWYWENRGTKPVNVQIQVSGFQEALYQP